MKRANIFLTALLLCIGMGARADNVVAIGSSEGAPGEEVTVSIGLTNTDALSSLQLSIPIDENLTLVEGSAQVGSRCAGHSANVGVKDGALQVVVYSLSMATIAPGSGDVATFRLKLAGEPVSVTLQSTKTMLTDGNGNTVNGSCQSGTVTIRCSKAQFDTDEIDFGRVPIRSTYTREVAVTNVGNANLVISSLEFSDVNVFSSTTQLPKTITPSSTANINVTFAPTERGATLRQLRIVSNSSTRNRAIKLKALPYAVNELHIGDASGISDEEVTITMRMNNMDDISGYQVEFVLPSSLQYVDGSFAINDSRKQDHVGAASIVDGTLRLLAYSPSGKPLKGNDGEIGSFRVKLVGRKSEKNLTPIKTVLSATINNKVENVVSDVYGGRVTIQYPTISTANEIDFGAVSVTEVCKQTFSIKNGGNAPLTISRIVFNNEHLSVEEAMPLVIPKRQSSNVTVVYSSMEETAFEAKMQIYSNDPDRRLHEVNVRGSRFAPNYLGMQIPDVFEEENVKVNLYVNTYDDVTGLQFDMEYPNSVYEPFDDNIQLSERAKGMTVSSRQMSPNTIRYVCYFLGGGGIAAGEGEVMSISLKPVADVVPIGTYTVSIKNVKLGTAELADKYAGSDVSGAFRVKKDDVLWSLPSNKWSGAEYTVQAISYDSKYGYGDWNESNPNYNKIVGVPEADANGRNWYDIDYSCNWEERTAPLKNWCNNFGDIYVRREFYYDSNMPAELYLACGHDDAPCEYYLNGEPIWSETDGWFELEYYKLTEAQKALLRPGELNVLAFHVHQNWGGMYADGGLYTSLDEMCISNQCGDNLFWTFDAETGTLTFTGTGDMYDYISAEATPGDTAPWAGLRKSVKHIALPSGITGIGNYAFQNCRSLESVTIPESVASIGNYAFYGCKRLIDVYCYAKNVPVTGNSVFDESNIFYAMLFVPATFLESYKKTQPWKGFGFILPIGELNTETIEIASAADLANFANRVNAGEVAINARLKADIDFTAYPNCMIGDGILYRGDFDGAGHTITLDMQRSGDYAALFHDFAGHVHDLTVTGSITTSAKYAAGIASVTKNATIERCQSRVNIISSVNGDGTHGGIVGVAYDGTVIRDCLVSGSITGSQTNCCGGVAGWAGGTINISNCLISGQFSVSTSSGDILSRNSSNVISTNNYFQGNWNAANACGNVTRLTANQVESGEACYRLNNGRQNDDMVWYQTLGEDDFPVPDNRHLPVLFINGEYVNENSALKGDVNDNGTIDIGDAVCIVNHIVGKPNAVFVERAADVNGNGIFGEIGDAVSVVNIIVGKAMPQAARKVKENRINMLDPQ